MRVTGSPSWFSSSETRALFTATASSEYDSADSISSPIPSSSAMRTRVLGAPAGHADLAAVRRTLKPSCRGE